MVSERVDSDDLHRLGFEQLAWQRFAAAQMPAVWRTGSFAADQRRYLEYHRSAVLVGDGA